MTTPLWLSLSCVCTPVHDPRVLALLFSFWLPRRSCVAPGVLLVFGCRCCFGSCLPSTRAPPTPCVCRHEACVYVAAGQPLFCSIVCVRGGMHDAPLRIVLATPVLVWRWALAFHSKVCGFTGA